MMAAVQRAERGVYLAGLSLHVDGHGPEQLARMLQIVGSSDLSVERKAAISERLQTQEAVAQSVSAAVRAAMGFDDAESRLALEGALEDISRGLREGAPAGGAWELATGGRVALDGEGSHAQQLVRGIGEQTPLGGSTILAFVQRVHLDLLFEEEDDDLPTPAPE